MTDPNAARREFSTMARFYEKVAALRDARSFAAHWLEDFRDSLAKIFGLEPSRAWEHLLFESGIHFMLETVDRMEKEIRLRIIDRDSYEQAKREWNGTDARALIRRERTFVMNLEKLNDLRANCEGHLDGTPMALENEGATAHCRNELMRLFRMHRLSR